MNKTTNTTKKIICLSILVFGLCIFSFTTMDTLAKSAKKATVTLKISYWDAKGKKQTKTFKKYNVKKNSKFSLSYKKLPSKAGNTRVNVKSFKVTKNMTKTISYKRNTQKVKVNYKFYNATSNKWETKTLKTVSVAYGNKTSLSYSKFPSKAGNTRVNLASFVVTKNQTKTVTYKRNNYKVNINIKFYDTSKKAWVTNSWKTVTVAYGNKVSYGYTAFPTKSNNQRVDYTSGKITKNTTLTVTYKYTAPATPPASSGSTSSSSSSSTQNTEVDESTTSRGDVEFESKPLNVILIYRDENYGWIGNPIAIKNVKVGDVIDTTKNTPKGYEFPSDDLKKIKITEDVFKNLENPDTSDYLSYLQSNTNTWILNIPMKKLPIPNHAEKEKGLTLDVARRNYTVPVIKQFIDTLSQKSNTFLHLHLSDDQNFGVESELLGQVASEDNLKEGLYVNPETGKSFLSKAQLEEIVAYAKDKGVNVIPEIDTPSHMSAIMTLLQESNPTLLDAIRMPDSNGNGHNTLDYSKPEMIQFIEDLYSEYLPIFNKQETPIFHMGGDEFTDAPPMSDPAYVNYVNHINEFLNKNGFTTRIWNDGFFNGDLDNFDKNIQITYWSQTGFTDKNVTDIRAQLSKENKPDANTLLQHGFKLLNYNGYYNYFMAGSRCFNPEAVEYTCDDLLFHWDIDEFELDTDARVDSTENVLGSAFSIWGEESKGYNDQQIFDNSLVVLNTYLEKVSEVQE